MLDIAEIQAQLQAQADAIRALIADITPEQARWKPDADSWSILEVINHLADEERNDFRPRLDLTLHQPDAPWPPNDPQRWVSERRYNERDFAESIADFATERKQSLSWLAELAAPNWDQVHEIPDIGSLSAGELMASWLAHDLLHTRQLMELRYHYLARRTEPYSVAYAGDY